MNEPKDLHTYSWKDLKDEFLSAASRPRKSPKFVGYFILVVCCIGGWGIIDPILKFTGLKLLKYDAFYSNLMSGIYTYFIAIAATAVIDVAISKKSSDAFKLYCHFAGVIVFVCGLIVSFGPIDNALIPALIGYFTSLLLWWIANSSKEELYDSPIPPTTPTGGDPNINLSGNTAEFKV